MKPSKVYIALGSNLALPTEQIRTAVLRLSECSELEQVQFSPWYRTQAIGGPENQPDYINAACVCSTSLNPNELLALLQSFEHQQGRVREVRWGPRTLDLDLIWYENFTSDNPSLTVPHPRAHQRAFVLQPLLDLGAGHLELQGHPLAYWRQQCKDQRIELMTVSEIDTRT